jgi:hypothetical protein
MKNEIRGGDIYVYVPNKDIARVHVTQHMIININKRCVIVFDTHGRSRGYTICWYKLELN